VWWVEGDLGVLSWPLGLGWAAVPDFLLHRWPRARWWCSPDFITQPELALEL
jgi:hypothetical protein